MINIEPLNIGVVVCNGINNKYKGTKIRAEYNSVKKDVINKFSDIELTEYSVIKRWREIYKSFGEKKSRSSVEALIRRLVNGNDIPTINPLVDI